MTAGSRRGEVGLSLKICLAGDVSVGKTSLVRRFVSDTFDDRYTSTLGAKVSSRRFSIPDPLQPAQPREVAAAIWDVMGNLGFRELLKDAYFHGVQAVLLVADATRPETVHSLSAWMKTVQSVAGDVPTVVLVNKADLPAGGRVTPDRIEAVCAPKGWKWLMTSAKTGENVAAAFDLAAHLYLESLARARAHPPAA